MYSLEYVSPVGDTFDLFSRDSGVRVEFDTLSGLVGSFEDSSVELVGEPGQRVNFLDRVVKPLEGSFTAVVDNPDVWREWYSAWSTVSEGTLVLHTNYRTFRLPVTLAKPLPFPSSRPVVGSRVDVDVISHGGVWLEEHSGTGEVTITNYGDVPIWGDLSWEGAGGDVVLPSGAHVTLPPVDSLHTLPLRRSNSGRVWRDGKRTTRRVDAVCESVPVGESRTFSTPTGCVLSWNVGVFSPWS